MKCPYCSFEDTVVKDSRAADDGSTIRRRRACEKCDARFTTFEKVQVKDIASQIDQIANRITSLIEQTSQDNNVEITSQKIGELVLNELAKVDKVAYIRFASVWLEFTDPADFKKFLSKKDAV
jgi:transcriptional repressor NrdR